MPRQKRIKMPKTFKLPVENERSQMRKLFAEFAKYESAYPALRVIYHIPNEGRRSLVAGRLAKLEGLRKGMPDIHLPVARGRYHSLFIELKTSTGTLSPEQLEKSALLVNQGNLVWVARGWQEAFAYVMQYLALSIPVRQ